MRIIIAEDQGILRGALASLLQLEEDIEVVAQVSNGREALEAIHRYQPDLALLDIEMPILSGLEVAERLLLEKSNCKVLIVTTFARPGYLERAIRANVSGYLLKDEPIEELHTAIRKVLRGKKVISPQLAISILDYSANPLSEREQEVLRLARTGISTKEIANSLYLTEGTVRNYLSSAIQKLDVDTRQNAVKIAEEKGWI